MITVPIHFSNKEYFYFKRIKKGYGTTWKNFFLNLNLGKEKYGKK